MNADPRTPSALRLDKWLWAARFYKTRGLAAEAVAGGKVHVNGQRVKPSRAVQVGDELEIQRGEERFTVIVRALNAQRRPAPEARMLYEETPQSEARRAAERERRRLQQLSVPHAAGRPDKRDRRRIRRLLGKD